VRGISPQQFVVDVGGRGARRPAVQSAGSLVPLQAIPLALIASLYPFGLAALFLLLQASRPKARAGVFLAGAAVCTLTVGFLFVFALRGAGVNQNGEQTPRYGLELGLGIAFLLGAWLVAGHVPKPKTDDEPSRVTKAAGAGLFAVFVVGIAMYTPSPTYLAALEVVSSAKLSTAATAAWVVFVVFLLLVTIEVPILLFWLAPGWTIPKLSALNLWLGRNGRRFFAVVLAVLGVWEAARGLVGLL
jgi:hypothetical protein